MYAQAPTRKYKHTHTHLVDATHCLHLLLFHFQLGLPDEIGARHKFSLPVEDMQHRRDQHQKQHALHGQAERKAVREKYDITD